MPAKKAVVSVPRRVDLKPARFPRGHLKKAAPQVTGLEAIQSDGEVSMCSVFEEHEVGFGYGASSAAAHPVSVLVGEDKEEADQEFGSTRAFFQSLRKTQEAAAEIDPRKDADPTGAGAEPTRAETREGDSLEAEMASMPQGGSDFDVNFAPEESPCPTPMASQAQETAAEEKVVEKTEGDKDLDKARAGMNKFFPNHDSYWRTQHKWHNKTLEQHIVEVCKDLRIHNKQRLFLRHVEHLMLPFAPPDAPQTKLVYTHPEELIIINNYR